MWLKYGLKAQKLLAQGIALGIIAISKAPCKGKSLVNTRFFKAFALTGRQGCVHNNPGRCPGLGASALSGRVERNLRKLKTSSLFAAGFKKLELWFKKKHHPSPRHHNTYPSSYSQHLFSWLILRRYSAIFRSNFRVNEFRNSYRLTSGRANSLSPTRSQPNEYQNKK